MGNSNSDNKSKEDNLAKYGGIYLKPNKDRYHPGEQFEGIIYLNLLTSYPGDSLYIQVKGLEKWVHAYTTHSNKRTHHHLGKEKETFLDVKIPVYKNLSGQDFQPGQYAFPISFLIPLNIPASVYLEGTKFIASIEFKVKAILDTFDPKASKLKYKEQLLIEENRKTVNSQLQQREEIALMICCCCNYGFSTVSLQLEKDILMPGETTNMRFSVDNSEGRLSFISVKCELIEKTVLGNNRFRFNRHPVAISLPGFKAGGNLLEQVVQLTLPPYSQINAKNKKIHQKRITSYSDISNIIYPENEIVPTTLGKIVNISYSLAVELIYDGCCSCCFDNAIAHIPVQIFIPDFKFEPTVEAPMAWAPQVMPTVNLSLGPLNESYGGGNQTYQGTEQQLGKMQIQDNFMKPQTSYDSSTFSVELQMTQRQITD